MTTTELLKKTRAAWGSIRGASAEEKDRILLSMAASLEECAGDILACNGQDMDRARGHISEVMLDRLRLDEERVRGMADGIRATAALPDHTGRILSETVHPNGMHIYKVQVPLGLVAIIYESRPNVTSDAAALAIKSGNVCMLRSGKEAILSARAIVRALKKGIAAAGGDLDKALRIIINAKTSRPSVCNAEEVCLVHRAAAPRFLPMLKAALVDERRRAGLTPVELRLDAAAAQIIDGTPAGEADFDTEFLDYILAVAVVDSLDAAIAHVLAHSTHHSDAIVTESAENAERFVNETDSAAVYVNASTRFTDGGEFGLGCEMGISTQKLHARGPMGLDELSTYKYIIRGSGQIR